MAAMKALLAPGASARHGLAQASALILVLILPACFSFRVTVPDEPEEVVGVLAVVCTPPASLDLEKPVADEALNEDAAAVHCLIKVLQVSKPLLLQWHWYSPDNLRVRSSRTVEVNAKSRYLAYFVAWDTLPREYYSGKKGNWTAVITAGGRFLVRKEFTIN